MYLHSTTSVAVAVATQVAFSDVATSVFVAGMAGGFIRYTRTGGGLKVFAMTVLTGGICAQYLGPLALDVYSKWTGAEVTDATGQTGGFLMGLAGVAFVGLIIDTFESKAAIAKRGSEE